MCGWGEVVQWRQLGTSSYKEAIKREDREKGNVYRVGPSKTTETRDGGGKDRICTTANSIKPTNVVASITNGLHKVLGSTNLCQGRQRYTITWSDTCPQRWDSVISNALGFHKDDFRRPQKYTARFPKSGCITIHFPPITQNPSSNTGPIMRTFLNIQITFTGARLDSPEVLASLAASTPVCFAYLMSRCSRDQHTQPPLP